jgi:hypothetical protein
VNGALKRKCFLRSFLFPNGIIFIYSKQLQCESMNFCDLADFDLKDLGIGNIIPTYFHAPGIKD